MAWAVVDTGTKVTPSPLAEMREIVLDPAALPSNLAQFADR